MEKLKVLVADPISARGVEELQREPAFEVIFKTGLKEDQLLEIIPGCAALIVRSETKVNKRVLEAATALRVVGRAGVGVDNVDVEAATARGVIVMNTPDGNTISTAEHAFSLLVSTARTIPQAHASMVAGKWERKKFQGVELYGKTLAILGMGRIGGELARRAIAFGMKVLAYDPYLAASRARALQVELVNHLDDVLPDADFISMHMPLTAETRHMLDARRLALCKPGVRIVNCARGGLIDETALLAALESGHVAGAALDVFEVEPPPAEFPLRGNPKMVFTPHLGASTAEAQESVGIEIAHATRAALLEGVIRNAVNLPSVDAQTLAIIGPYLSFGVRLGRFLSQIAPGGRYETLTINYSGRVNEADTGPITRAVVKGYLEAALGPEMVNPVNALARAKERGLQVNETRQNVTGDFSDLLEVSLGGGEEKMVSVAGTFFGAQARIVRINGEHIEAKPEGVLLLLENRDVPGIIGKIGTLLGGQGVNIATMSLSREAVGGQALTVLNLDSAPEPAAIEQIVAAPDILSARVVRL
jgi:D-3-phosphoglycerate dehydrogenase